MRRTLSRSGMPRRSWRSTCTSTRTGSTTAGRGPSTSRRSSTTSTGTRSSRISSGRSPCRRSTSRLTRTRGERPRDRAPTGARSCFGRTMATTNMLPVIGKPAPDFSLPSTTGESVSLRQFKGKKTVVLYFYPKDETPGCTREACGFRDLAAEFDKAGAVILGVSPDPMDSHHKFKDKHKLPFPLLADADATVARAYGVWKQKNLYGKKYMGIERTTFVIDRTGRIAQIYPKVK